MSDAAPVQTIQLHLCVAGAEDAIAFYNKAFGAELQFKQMATDGKRVLHATLGIFGGQIMMHDEFPEHSSGVLSPKTHGGASVAINVNLAKPADVDAAMKRATEHGANVLMPPANQFWGARYGRLRDPFGHIWAFNAPLKAHSAA
jgi:PhnB protein